MGASSDELGFDSDVRAEIIRVTELSRRIVHFRSGEKLAYVVVFRNPEHRQQWVTEAEGQRIIKELQR